MNEDDMSPLLKSIIRERLQRKVFTEFQIGHSRLLRRSNLNKLRAEIDEVGAHLYALFESQGPRGLEFIRYFHRLIRNVNEISSYRGIIQGFEINEYANELRKERVKFHLLVFLQEHPKAKNRELIAYLNQRNGRHQELKTPQDDPQWAPLPPPLQKRLGNRKISPDAWWDTAMREFPDEVRVYLSRVRREAKTTEVKNVLFDWSKLAKIREKERRKRDAV